MNVLGLVFSILLIISYTYYASWEQHATLLRLRQTYVCHEEVQRKILNSFQSEIYQSLGRAAPASPKKEKPTKVETEPEEPEEPTALSPAPNRECARINLWPLIQEGKEHHEILYELAAKLIRTFYPSITPLTKRFEYYFLDTMLSSAKALVQEENGCSLEKIVLPDPLLQKYFYKMLKGTKHWDLRQKVGYPSLLDYVKAEPSEEKICVFHAHPDLIAILFDETMGWKLYSEIHGKNASPLTKELIEKISAETHRFHLDPDLLKLLQLGRPNHEEYKKTFVAQDAKGDLILRKKICTQKSF